MNMDFKGWISKAKDFLAEMRRVIIVAKKPDADELVRVIKVVLLGMAIIGFIGFTVLMIKYAVLGT